MVNTAVVGRSSSSSSSSSFYVHFSMLARVGRPPHMHPLHFTRSSAQSLFKPSETISFLTLRSADTLTLDVPRTRLSFGDRAFIAAGPRAWNKLPLHVRSAHSMTVFKKLLKTHLFLHAYL